MKTVDILRNMQYLPGEIVLLEDAVVKLEEENQVDGIAAICEIRNETISLVQERLNRCNAQLQKCVRIITAVEATDPQLYEILALHYIKGMNWTQIAAMIKPKAAPDTYKQRVHRWATKRDKEANNKLIKAKNKQNKAERSTT